MYLALCLHVRHSEMWSEGFVHCEVNCWCCVGADQQLWNALSENASSQICSANSNISSSICLSGKTYTPPGALPSLSKFVSWRSTGTIICSRSHSDLILDHLHLMLCSLDRSLRQFQSRLTHRPLQFHDLLRFWLSSLHRLMEFRLIHLCRSMLEGDNLICSKLVWSQYGNLVTWHSRQSKKSTFPKASGKEKASSLRGKPCLCSWICFSSLALCSSSYESKEQQKCKPRMIEVDLQPTTTKIEVRLLNQRIERLASKS